MKKFLFIAAAVLSLAACGKNAAQQLAEAASKVSVICEPAVLQKVGETIDADITVNYPAGYFSKDAMVVVVPVIVYDGGEMTGMPFTYQGVNVKQNYKVVPTTGGTVHESVSFPYVKGMEKCRLELRSKAFLGGKEVQVPVIKVADGCINLVRWAESGGYGIKPDNYQAVISEFAEGQIHYDVNSSNVKNSQLTGKSIKDFEQALAEGRDNERIKIKGTKIISYASPEGGEEYNSKLSDKRSDAAEQAWKKIGKGSETAVTEVQSVGQDWEGFKEAISKSNLEDKDLILRVLSMYSDPAVRESEIKNLSQVYTELKQSVFPELRRSRFITEMEYQNYSEEDLQRLLDRKLLYLLDEEAILHLAAINDSVQVKENLYRAAAERMGSQRGLYNLGVLLMRRNSNSAAEVYFDKLKDQNDGDLLNARGVIALKDKDYAKALDYFTKSGTAQAKANEGLVYLLQGEYAKAGSALAGSGDRNEAIADILNGKYDHALQVLDRHTCPVSYYLRAVASARKKDAAGVRKYLDIAAQKAPAIKNIASKDIEFEGFDF